VQDSASENAGVDGDSGGVEHIEWGLERDEDGILVLGAADDDATVIISAREGSAIRTTSGTPALFFIPWR